ncbi:uncharacterized protein LOC119183907 [Rhipicephalus microplus]|uniref:uncharacterized protein LOC119183907 n=1 Tax=Rhipicephalus microplus TaxID=6941 RepID=UPI003F6D3B19
MSCGPPDDNGGRKRDFDWERLAPFFDRSSSGEPDGLQESKRQAREASGGHPIVWGPVKVPPGQEDEVAKRVQNAMGDFDTAQWLFTHHRDQLFGIAGTSAAAQNRTPPTVSSPVGNGSAPTARNVNATDPGATTNGSSNSQSFLTRQQHRSNGVSSSSSSSSSGGASSGSSTDPANQSRNQNQRQSSSHQRSSSLPSHHANKQQSGDHHKQQQQQPHRPPPRMDGQCRPSSTRSSSAHAKDSKQLSQPRQGSSYQRRESWGSSYPKGWREDAMSKPKAGSSRASNAALSAASTTKASGATSSNGPLKGLSNQFSALRTAFTDVNKRNSSSSARRQSSTSSTALTMRAESTDPAAGSSKSSSVPTSSASLGKTSVSAEHDTVRERERLRWGLGGGDSGKRHTFGDPNKGNPGQEAETSRRAKITMDDYKERQRRSRDPKYLFGIPGISAAVQTRAPAAVSSSKASTRAGNTSDPGETRSSTSNNNSSWLVKQQNRRSSLSKSTSFVASSGDSVHSASRSRSLNEQQGPSNDSSSGQPSRHVSRRHSHHHHEQQPHQPPPSLMESQYKHSSASSSSAAAGTNNGHLFRSLEDSSHPHH